MATARAITSLTRIKEWFRQAGRAAAAPAAATQHRSFLVYGRFRYLKIGLGLCVLSAILYGWHEPNHGPSGNTWLGYGLGTIGAGLIVWLAWFGVRKRQFREGQGTMQGWLSAHVYLGLSLLVVATLHTGFQLGWNVHTLAYVLMLLVIASGIYGVLAFANLPSRITANRGQTEFRTMLAEVARLNEQALTMADKIDPETHAVILRSVGNVRIGGGAWEQLSGRYRAAGDPAGLDRFLDLKKTALLAAPVAEAAPRGGAMATIAFVADQMFSAGADIRSETLQKLLQFTGKRKSLVERINRDITLRTRMQVWLYFHVPLTVALLVALFAHILSTFLYW